MRWRHNLRIAPILLKPAADYAPYGPTAASQDTSQIVQASCHWAAFHLIRAQSGWHLQCRGGGEAQRCVAEEVLCGGHLCMQTGGGDMELHGCCGATASHANIVGHSHNLSVLLPSMPASYALAWRRGHVCAPQDAELHCRWRCRTRGAASRRRSAAPGCEDPRAGPWCCPGRVLSNTCRQDCSAASHWTWLQDHRSGVSCAVATDLSQESWVELLQNCDLSSCTAEQLLLSPCTRGSPSHSTCSGPFAHMPRHSLLVTSRRVFLRATRSLPARHQTLQPQLMPVDAPDPACVLHCWSERWQ